MRRLSLLATATAVVSAGALPLAGRAQAQTNTCAPSTVMVLFDRSSSMRNLIGTETKWQQATDALKDVLTTYQDQADFGLTLFPKTTWSCAAGVVNVAPERNALNDIEAALPGTLAKNYWTPIGRTLAAVPSMAGMTDASKRRVVILVTDGKESCPEDDYPGNSQSDGLKSIPNPQIVATVKSLKASGITTYVVGFGNIGAEGDALLLNQLAEAGGTKRTPDCVESSDASNPKGCYYQANDGQELIDVLQDIGSQISAEVCDGKDNNCNGEIDEGIPPRPCQSVCGSGTEHCELGKWVGCTAPQPSPEVCGDGKDNDCNGQVDETCECQDGQTKACGKGVCAGQQHCVNHHWGACDGAPPTNQSECDGIDHDCNGAVDNADCECVPGQMQTCGGPDIGQCKSGVRVCDANGHWPTDCPGAVGPTPETCDGVDNNCDGKIDNPTLTGNGDDVPRSLCRADQVCQSGHCIPAPPVATPPPIHAAGGDASGCACGVGAGPSAPPLGTVLLVVLVAGAIVAGRRRR